MMTLDITEAVSCPGWAPNECAIEVAGPACAGVLSLTDHGCHDDATDVLGRIASALGERICAHRGPLAQLTEPLARIIDEGASDRASDIHGSCALLSTRDHELLCLGDDVSVRVGEWVIQAPRGLADVAARTRSEYLWALLDERMVSEQQLLGIDPAQELIGPLMRTHRAGANNPALAHAYGALTRRPTPAALARRISHRPGEPITLAVGYEQLGVGLADSERALAELDRSDPLRIAPGSARVRAGIDANGTQRARALLVIGA